LHPLPFRPSPRATKIFLVFAPVPINDGSLFGRPVVVSAGGHTIVFGPQASDAFKACQAVALAEMPNVLPPCTELARSLVVIPAPHFLFLFVQSDTATISWNTLYAFPLRRGAYGVSLYVVSERASILSVYLCFFGFVYGSWDRSSLMCPSKPALSLSPEKTVVSRPITV